MVLNVFLFVGLFVFAAEEGCDWWIRTKGHWNPSQTSWGKRCEDLNWLTPEGKEIPASDVVCCNFDANGNYDGTGINCSRGTGLKRVPEGSELPKELNGEYPNPMLTKRTQLHGNWAIENNLKIAMNKDGDVGVYHLALKENVSLFNLSEKYHHKPVNITALPTDKGVVTLVVAQLENKTNKMDTSGSEYITYQTSELKKLVYEKNMANIVSLYPNPVVQGNTLKVTALNNGIPITFCTYNQSGKLMQQVNPDKNGLNVETKTWEKGIYFYYVIIDGVKIKGGLISVE